MIHKITISVSGEKFLPEVILNKDWGDFFVESYHNPSDKKFENADDEYGYGGMIFWHSKQFCLQDKLPEYEGAFVDFIEENYQLLSEIGMEDLEVLIEVYYDGGQCNFEIFDKGSLARMANFNIAIPVSVYAINQIEIQQWENEIELEWIEPIARR